MYGLLSPVEAKSKALEHLQLLEMKAKDASQQERHMRFTSIKRWDTYRLSELQIWCTLTTLSACGKRKPKRLQRTLQESFCSRRLSLSKSTMSGTIRLTQISIALKIWYLSTALRWVPLWTQVRLQKTQTSLIKETRSATNWSPKGMRTSQRC